MTRMTLVDDNDHCHVRGAVRWLAKNKAALATSNVHMVQEAATVISLVIKHSRTSAILSQCQVHEQCCLASTGVTATYLHGDTIHSRGALMQDKVLSEDQKNAWTETRLLIVEISMLAPQS
jgi:hypothetical protein